MPIHPHRTPSALLLPALLMLLSGPAVRGQEPDPEPPSTGLDPSLSIHQYAQESWTTEDGLPSNAITDIAQTADGYLWLATHGGLVRFDGVRFKVFDTSNEPGLPSNYLTQILVSRDGAIWVGTNAGVARLRDGTTSAFGTDDGLAGAFVDDLLEDRAGVVWIVAGGQAHRFEEERIAVVARPGPMAAGEVNSVTEAADGTLWLTTRNHGLLRFENGEWQRLTTNDGLPDNRLYSAFHDRDGTLWIAQSGDDPRALYRYVGGRFIAPEGLGLGPVRAFCQSRNGVLWIGSVGGLHRYVEGSFESYRVGLREPGHRFFALFEDRDGSLWMGTYAGGLQRLAAHAVTMHSDPDGVRGQPLAIFQDHNDDLWVGSDGGLSLYEEDGFVPVEAISGPVRTIGEDHSGRLWLGTSDALLLYSKGTVTRYSTEGPVTLVYPDSNDGLFVGLADVGLRRFRDGVFSEIDGLEDLWARSVARDSRGVVWIGTGHRGLLRLEEGRLTATTTGDGLATDTLQSLLLDEKSGDLWIGTQGSGLQHLKDGRISTYTTADGLQEDIVLAVLQDQEGNLWLLGDSGISRVNKDELLEVAEGRSPSVRSVAYGGGDGEGPIEGIGGGEPSAWRSSDGRLWFTTMQGVAEVVPWRSEPTPALSPLLIEEIVVDGVEIEGRTAATLRPGTGTVEIRFTTPTFRRPGEVEFQYRLEGVDRSWREVRLPRLATYTHLPPGDHRFEVRARRPGEAWSDTTAALELVVLPAWFQTAWFRALVTLGLVALVLATVRLSTRRVARRNAELEREISLRREAERSLRASESLNRATLDSLASPVAVLDRDGSIIKVNETWKRSAATNGAESDLVEGIGWNYLEVCRAATGSDGPFGRHAADGLQAILEGRAAVFDMEYPFHSLSGDRWFLMRAVPMGGSEKGAVVSHIDVTGRRLAERELRSSEEKMRQQREQLAHVQRTASLGELAGALSHEISQPLTAIRSNTQAALRFLSVDDPDLDELREILEDVAHDDLRATQILQRLRRLLQRKPTETEDLDLNRVIAEVVSLLRSEALLDKIEIAMQLEEGLPSVEGDPVQLQQVIMNLMTNAMDAIRESSDDVRRIVLSTSAETAGAVRVSVADSGVGFGDQSTQKVFDAFHTTKPAGLGIGLAISRTIVEAHGGKIWAESGPGGGAVFHFTLPVGSGTAT